MSPLEGTKTSPAGNLPTAIKAQVSINVRPVVEEEGELLVEAVLRHKKIPHICYHSPLMDSIQAFDTRLVGVDDKLCARAEQDRRQE